MHEEKGQHVICEGEKKNWIGIFDKAQVYGESTVVELEGAYEYIASSGLDQTSGRMTVDRTVVPLCLSWSGTSGMFHVRSIVRITKDEYDSLVQSGEKIRRDHLPHSD